MNWNTKSLMRLYPPEWRERYGEEFLALLDQRPYTFGNWIDVLLGAIDANLRPQISGSLSGNAILTVNRLLSSIMVGFCAYSAFVVAGLAFYGMVDDSPFIPVMRSHFEFRSAWNIVAFASALALLAIIIGGGPIVLAVLRQSLLTKRKDLLLLLLTPVFALVALVAFWGGTAIIMALLGLEGKMIPRLLGTLVLAMWASAFVIATGMSIAAVWAAIARSNVNIRLYRFARIPAAVTAMAMAVMLIGTVGWGLVADMEVHEAFVANLLGWLLIVAAMAISTYIAAIEAARATAVAL